jgi:hypothetical protein
MLQLRNPENMARGPHLKGRNMLPVTRRIARTGVVWHQQPRRRLEHANRHRANKSESDRGASLRRATVVFG